MTSDYRVIAFFFIVLLYPAHTQAAKSIYIVPGLDWGFTFISPKVLQHRGSATATEYHFQGSTEIGFVFSGYVEPSEGKGKTIEECQNFYWSLAIKNPQIRKSSVSFKKGKLFNTVTYTMDSTFKGKKFIQLSANFYGFKENKCIDIHISQVFAPQAKLDAANIKAFSQSLAYFILK